MIWVEKIINELNITTEFQKQCFYIVDILTRDHSRDHWVASKMDSKFYFVIVTGHFT